MGWSIGNDASSKRFIGYGVPAVCEEPSCDTSIDRGLAYACGGGVMEDLPNCGMFFCSDHLQYKETRGDQGFVCARCRAGKEPFPHKPEDPRWVEFMSKDKSWAKWRDENPQVLEDMLKGAPL